MEGGRRAQQTASPRGLVAYGRADWGEWMVGGEKLRLGGWTECA